ncbi:hypothetical protein PMAYCL1PPCAC_13796, partial [Pristionchus mayeri]
ARPAFELICSYLRTAIFALVSSPFRTGVKIFMGREKNRPAVDNAYLTNAQGGLRVEIMLFRVNLPFYDMTNLLGSIPAISKRTLPHSGNETDQSRGPHN